MSKKTNIAQKFYELTTSLKDLDKKDLEKTKKIQYLENQNKQIKKRLLNIEEELGIEKETQKSTSTQKKSSGLPIALIIIGILLSLTGLGLIIGIPLIIIGIIMYSNQDQKKTAPEKVSTPEKTNSKSNIEETLGITWFARIGILALVVGIGFFIKYAIDMNWINELARIALALVLGIGLITSGKIISKKLKYENWAKTLIGGGYAITYFAVYASYYFEDYKRAIGTSFSITILLLTIITLAAIISSLRDNSKIIAYQAFLLGYITTFLSNDLTSLSIVYSILLAIGFVVISLVKKWPVFGLVGMFAAHFWSYLWLYQNETLSMSLAVILTHFVLFNILAYKLSLNEKQISLAIFVSNSVLTYIGLMITLLIIENTQHALYTFLLAMLHLLLFLWYKTKQNKDFYMASAYLASTYLAIAIPLQFAYYTITIMWSLLLFLFMLIYKITSQKGFKILSIILTFIVLINLSLNNLQSTKSIISIPFVIASLYGVYILLRFYKNLDLKENEDLIALYNWLGLISLISYFYILFEYLDMFFGSIIILILLTNTIVFKISLKIKESFELQSKIITIFLALNILYFMLFYSALLNILNTILYILLPVTIWYLASFVKNREESLFYSLFASGIAFIYVLVNFEGAVISLGWALLAALLLLIGFLLKTKQYRLQSIFLFGIIVLKVFIYDTRNLEMIFRTLSYIALGIILLAISFIYTKYKNNLKELI